LPSDAGSARARHVAVARLDDPARRVVAAIDEHGAEYRLQRIREDRGTRSPAGLVLAFTEADLVSEPRAACDPREHVLVDERGARARQVAFGKRGKASIERGGDDAVQHGVTDELEALVVRGAEAAVRQRAAEQVGIANA
jgi:hypothetical protein